MYLVRTAPVRKQYSKEFKLDSVTWVVEQKYSRVEVVRNLGLSPQILGRWLKEAEEEDDDVVILLEVMAL